MHGYLFISKNINNDNHSTFYFSTDWTEVAANICYGSDSFDVPKGTSKVLAIRLRHISGDSECTSNAVTKTHWGCPHDANSCATDNCFTTLVIQKSPTPTAYYPSPQTDRDVNGLLKIPGFRIDDENLVFNFAQAVDGPLSFQVRHYNSFSTTEGTHCIEVDAKYE